MMKYLKAPLLFFFSLLLTLQGCTSTSVLGLSRASHTDDLEARLEHNELINERTAAELEELSNRDDRRMVTAEEEIALLQSRMEEIESIRRDLDSLTAGFSTVQSDTSELQRLAEEFEKRLERVHEETLVLLIHALEDYLAREQDQKVTLSR